MGSAKTQNLGLDCVFGFQCLPGIAGFPVKVCLSRVPAECRGAQQGLFPVAGPEMPSPSTTGVSV